LKNERPQTGFENNSFVGSLLCDVTASRTVPVCRIRILLLIFILGLAVSGATAIPLETELRFLTQWAGGDSGTSHWFLKVRDALVETNAKYPFMAYGTDWLAFAHFVIAIAFIGPLRDPMKNVWVVEFGMIACALVVPFALVMGGIRGIPWGWRLIDCSFGIFGIVPLWFCRRQIKCLAKVVELHSADSTIGNSVKICSP
jgi:hypothetical protein